MPSHHSGSSPAHTPDNSFLGFVSAVEGHTNRKDKIAVVYGKQEYMWQVWWSHYM